MSEENENIVDVQIAEIPKAQAGGIKRFEFNLPEKFGSLPVPLSIKDLEQQDRACKKLFEYMQRQNINPKTKEPLAFSEGALFGKVSGIPRPMCFEPGLEMIMRFFQLKRGPTYKEEIPLDDIITDDKKVIKDHIKVKAWTIVLNGITGLPVYVLDGSASTKEAKHRFRGEGKKCPECDYQLRINKEKSFDNYYYCWKKHGGCGATFAKDNEEIAKQPDGRIENENPIDQHNTIEEVAVIRGLRKIIKFTGMSRYFIENPDAIGSNFSEDVVEDKQAQADNAKPDPQKTNGVNLDIEKLENLALDVFGDIDKVKAYFNKKGITNLNTINAMQYRTIETELINTR